MKYVLILGANGVLGSEITRQLAQCKNVEQTCYDIRQISYTLIRTADLIEADSMEYHLHKAGEKAHSRYVSRAVVANLEILMGRQLYHSEHIS